MASTNKSAVERLRAMDTQNKKVQGLETGSASSAVTRLRAMENQSNPPSTSDEEKNEGGVLGGIGYVGEKLGLGIVQGIEGIFDYVGAGVLDLFGADDAAEDILENDWLNYSHADEWFNPSEGWKVAGDVGGGIGTSVPGLAAGVVAGVATGGAGLIPTVAGLATSGLSAAGTSTKEAYQESGELGLKEYGYGAIMGGVEAGTEFLSGKIGAGILKNADDIAAAFGKTASKTAKAVSAKTIAASLGKEFASEAFEEGFSEFVSPYAKRLTYDPNAQNATIEEIGYAALVGGLSGMVMGGGTTTITQTTNLARGSKAVDAGRVTSIMDTAKAFSDYEGTSPTKLSSMEAIRDLYTRLESQGVRESTKLTVNQRRAIGELQSLTTSAVFEPAMQKSAISAIEGADVIAQKLNADGQIKIVDGKMQAVTAESLEELQKQGIEVRDITAEDIRGNADIKDGKSISKAMKENDLLRYIAASDVAGRFMMTAKEVETAARAGTRIKSQADLNSYIEKATPEQRAALGAELGIAENEWDTLKLQRFNEAAAAYRESGKLDAKRSEIKANAEKKKAAERINALKQKVETNKIDEYLRENVEGYASMGEANKSMIRQIVREGRASGISDADILSYAKVAEHTGLNVEFDASLKEGEAGYYDPKGNKIVVNPKTTKKQELILVHELDHALRKFVAGDKVHTIVYKNADKKLSQKTRDMIEKEYSDQDTDVSREELFADEASAYYSEAILGGKVTVDMLLGKETTLKQKILSFFTEAARAYSGDATLAKEARAHYRRFKKLFDSFAERNKGRNAMTATEARGKVNDSRFSLEFAPEIANNQREFLAAETRRRNVKKQQITLTEQELETAIAQTAEMVEAMSDKKDILPRDKVGKTLVKNGSYDVSVENTTICVRTLSYNAFVDMVSEKIGRPLSQMESFLVSQKLYDIAKEPQCLYCYVSLDRKAYNDMLLRYIEQRDAAIKAYVDAGKPKLTKESSLYKDFLDGRKPTDNMWDRYSGWIKQYNDGVHILTAEDIATEAKRSALFNSKDASQSGQVKDMLKYAQSASWAKKQTDYVAYFDDILKLSDKVIKDLNKHYGLRWYSFSDYSGAFIVENMQQITDAAIRGLKGLAYTKDTDFARIFAPTGMNINISVYAMKDGKGGYVIDEKQSANLKEAIELRKKYPNVGIVAVATDQQGVEWALAQEWSDVVIPFHTVRTGAQVAEFYDWTVFNEEQNDSVKDENLWNAYVDSVTNGNEKARKKVSKMVYPSEHQNNRETYLRIVEERGLKPRFSSFVENPNYMKLVNETRQSESATQPLKPTYDLAAAKESFGKFVDKGGYFEGWYNDGIDVDGEAELVAQDIREGKKANEVEYGRQDRNGNAIPTPEDIMASRKKTRSHGATVDKSARKSTEFEAEVSDEYKSPTEENVGKSRFDEPDVKLKDKITEKFTTTKDKVYIETIDETYGIQKYLTTRGKMKNADAFIQQVRATETIAQTMIGSAQYDITNNRGKRLGDGVQKIFKKYKLRNIEVKFNTYLLHQLNVDRMTLEERSLQKKEELRKEFQFAEAALDRARRDVDEGRRKTIPRGVKSAYSKAKAEYENYEVMKNKPVFGENAKREKAITAEESRKIIAEYEKHYPEFKESAEQVWAYSRNLLEMRVKAGLLSKADADFMEKLYPHYVPSFRDVSDGVGSGTVKNESQLAVKDTIKSATGGGSDVYDIEESIAIQTRQTIKAIKMNQLANAVFDSATFSGDTKYVLTEEAAEQRRYSDPDEDTDIDLKPKNNQIVFFRDGKQMVMNVSEEIFVGFKGLTDGSVPNYAIFRLASKALGAFKNLVTQYSPAFAARNFVRDMQDAIINTKHPKGFATHVKSALMGMVNNDTDWQTYLAYGGYASTVFDAKGFQSTLDKRGFEELKKISGIDAKDIKSMAIPLQNLLKVIGNANSFVEQLTRFTEYKASIAAGDSIEVAINNSAEVTTNFARHGTVVKVLNATAIPFLNASVQGFDKMLRVISGPYKEKSMTALAILLAKIVAIGITPQILNMIMNGDDEDYNALTDDVKSNYFLIKVGDQFIKIPRGRLAGAFGGLANQLRNVSRGEGFDAEGYAESIVSNLTPVDSFSRDILSPFRDVKTNTTWYGGEIEGRQFENVRPSQRYDESTSSIAIALGKAFNYSPKKIHYLLDQYTGVIGDLLLPATTKKAEKDYLSANFLLDPKTNNKLSNEFYKLYDEAQYAKNEGNVTAYYQLKHLNDIKDAVSELYDDITEIQNSDLSNSEKLQQVRTIRVLINNLYKTAKDDYGAYTQAIEATEGMFDESDPTQQRLRHTVITQMMYGSEKALEEYNSAVYEKASVFNKAGIDWDTYYEYYFTTRGIESDVDKNGEKVAGSKRKKVEKAIKALGVSQTERLLLTAAAGYSLTEAEKKRLISYINKLAVTKDEKIAIAEACGFTVKNGRISLK